MCIRDSFIHDPRFAADGQRRKEIVQTIDLPATVSVSYTHLDVYKRQAPTLFGSLLKDFT